MPSSGSGTSRFVQPGQVMLEASPSLKWASTWSAMITEIAIVISAWRSSCPWFQRRKTCWTMRPTAPITATATSAGKIHSQVFTSVPAIV